mmetsp:Transcript_4204/g.6206  ORF Transcript_4204/g.6206 Transcript_4204/m.6206 type:complete len:85 (+) Transcript_4204:117-371(+)
MVGPEELAVRLDSNWDWEGERERERFSRSWYMEVEVEVLSSDGCIRPYITILLRIPQNSTSTPLTSNNEKEEMEFHHYIITLLT